VSHGQYDGQQVGVQGAIGIQPSLTASLAVPILDVTILVAGGGNGLHVSDGAVSHGQYDGQQVGVQGALGIQPSLTANLAVPVLDVTILVAGGGNSLNMGQLAVSHRQDNSHQVGVQSALGIQPSLAASLAVPVLDVTILEAGGSNSLNMGQLVISIGAGHLVALVTDLVAVVGVLVSTLGSHGHTAVDALAILTIVCGITDALAGNADTHHAGQFAQVSIQRNGVTVLAVPVLHVTVLDTANGLLSLHVDDAVLSAGIGLLAALVAILLASKVVSVIRLGTGLKAADRAGLVASILVLVFAGSGSNNSQQVGVQGALGIQPSLTASLAVPVLDVTVHATGGGNSLHVGDGAVSHGQYDGQQVGVQGAIGIQPSLTAGLAVPVLDVTILVAGGGNGLHVSDGAVSHGQDNSQQVGVQGALGIQPSLTASLAVPILDVTILVAGGGNGLHVGDGAVSHGQYDGQQVGVQGAIGIQPSLTASLAVPILDVTILVAGGGNGLHVGDGAVSHGQYDGQQVGVQGAIGIQPSLTASLAVPILDVTILVAGGGNGLHVGDGAVSHGQYDGQQVGVQGAIGIQPSLTAGLAVPVLDVTILVAGGGNSLNVGDGAVSRLALGSTADRAGLGIGAGSVNPIVVQGVSIALAALGAGGGSGAGGLAAQVIGLHSTATQVADVVAVILGIHAGSGLAAGAEVFTFGFDGAVGVSLGGEHRIVGSGALSGGQVDDLATLGGSPTGEDVVVVVIQSLLGSNRIGGNRAELHLRGDGLAVHHPSDLHRSRQGALLTGNPVIVRITIGIDGTGLSAGGIQQRAVAVLQLDGGQGDHVVQGAAHLGVVIGRRFIGGILDLIEHIGQQIGAGAAVQAHDTGALRGNNLGTAANDGEVLVQSVRPSDGAVQVTISDHNTVDIKDHVLDVGLGADLVLAGRILDGSNAVTVVNKVQTGLVLEGVIVQTAGPVFTVEHD